MAETRGQADLHFTGPKKARKNHILAIAIDKYSNGQTPLYYPVAETERLVQLLTERYDFDSRNVRRLYDEKATRELLRDELYDLPDKLGPDDNLLLLFAGHGLYDEKIDEGYWVPVDAPGLKSVKEAEDVLFPFQRIVKYLNNAQAHHIVFVIDSCFSGKFGQVTMKAPAPAGNANNAPEETPSRWVLTSGRKELVADNSPFAQAMFEALKENSQEQLALPVLYLEIRQKMTTESSQTAYCREIVAGEASSGEFAFHLREGLAKPDAATAQLAGDVQQLRRRLRQGSLAYLGYLKKGRFAKLQFEELLLPDTQAELLDVEVSLQEIATPLRQALKQLWERDNPHTLICGEGGTGKTVSCVRLWEELLEAGEEGPIPIFLPLNEYNASTEAERETRSFLYQFIAREYLDDARLNPELEDALKQLFKKREGQPAAIFMLDGFNEVSVEKRELMVELAEFVRREKGVQIAVTSRYDMRSFTWIQGFERLDLLALTLSQIERFLQQHHIPPPESEGIQRLLSNPMMLTLFTGASQLAAQSGNDSRLSFKPRVSSQGELLHNFIEGQLAKYLLDNATNPVRDSEFLWQSFLLCHLLPYLAYRMVEEGQFFIHSRKLLNPAFNFKKVVEEAYHYFSSFDFTDLYPAYEGWRPWLGFGVAEKDYEAQEARNRRIRSYLTGKLFLLSEEGDTFGFLHQNFRDYFAAVHVQRSMELTTAQNQGLPPEKRSFSGPLQKAPLDFYVRQLLGELEGEHSNKMEWNEEKKRWQWSQGQFFLENHLAGLLEQCRGVFDEKQLGYTVWNLLTIWKEQRGEFSGADLRQLNFRKFSFNGVRASRPGLRASLCQGELWAENLFPQGHSAGVWSVAYSPDGGRLLTGSDDRTAKIWDAQTGQCLLTLEGHSDRVENVAFSPDGGRIVSGSYDKTAKVWDAQAGQCLLTLEGHSAGVNSAVFSSDEDRILTSSDDGTTKVWDAQTGQCLLTLEGHSNGVWSVAFSPNGGRILTGSMDLTAKIWDAQTGQHLLTLNGHRNFVMSIAYSPDGKRVITGSADFTTKVWDAQTGQCLLTLQGHSAWVMSIAYSPDGKSIITGSADFTTKVWNAQTGQCLLTLQGHSNVVYSVAYSPNGRRIATGSEDNRIKIWDAVNGQCLFTLQRNWGSVKCAVYSPDGDSILTGSSDNTAKIWDAKDGQCLLTLVGHLEPVMSLAYSRDGGHIVTGSDDNTAKVWDPQTGQCLLTLCGHMNGILNTAYSPDGKRILTGSMDNTAKVWDTESGKCLLTLKCNPDWIFCTAYSPDGRYIITGSVDTTAKKWDAQTGQSLLTMVGHWEAVWSAAYSPDGRRIVTGSRDQMAKVWDVESGQCLLTLQGHSDEIYSVAYKPDGVHIVTGSEDKTAKIWDVESGQSLLTLEGHSAGVRSTAYSPEGMFIVTGSDDNTAKVWDAQSGQCLLALPNVPGLFIQGCDFRGLHPDSELSEEGVALLRQYGGIFDEEDARRWKALMEKHFGVEKE